MFKQNEEILLFEKGKKQFLPLFKENYDGFNVRPAGISKPDRVLNGLELSGMWSDIGSLSLLIEKNRSICLQSKVFRSEKDIFEPFFMSIRSERKASNVEIFLQYPTKIANFLPFPLKLKIKYPYDNNQETMKVSDKKIGWIFEKNLDINDILLGGKINGILKNSTLPSLKINEKEEEINPGSRIYSNLLDYNANVAISIQLPGHRWTEFLSISGIKIGEKINSGDSYYFWPQQNINHDFFNSEPVFSSKEELFYFQSFNLSNEQTTIILEKNLEKNINSLVFFCEYWFLNETPFPLLTRIKENNYEYQWIKIPDLWVNSKEKPLFSQNFFNGLSHLSAHSALKDKSLNTLTNENNGFFIMESMDNLEKMFFSLNSAYFSQSDLKELIRKHDEDITIFSGNRGKVNKKISFQVESMSSWSDFFKITENKWSIFSQNNANNVYNFNYINLKLPGKFKRSSLILISPKYFIMNLSDFSIELKVLEGNKKRSLIKLEKGMIETLFNFQFENDIKISLRICKNDYIWSPE